MVTIREMGILAAAAYDTTFDPFEGWVRSDFHKASGGMNGFQAATFVKGTDTVIAFRGTDQAMDVVADLKLGTGMNSTYFADGDDYARSFRGNSSAYVCGHSLGGAIAQVVANRGGFKMVTFNAPGVAVLASRNMGSATAEMSVVRLTGMMLSALRHPMQAADDLVSAFNVVEGLNICLEWDVVSQIGVHYGAVIRIPGTSINPKTEHGIGTMNKVLETNPVGQRTVDSL